MDCFSLHIQIITPAFDHDHPIAILVIIYYNLLLDSTVVAPLVFYNYHLILSIHSIIVGDYNLLPAPEWPVILLDDDSVSASAIVIAESIPIHIYILSVIIYIIKQTYLINSHLVVDHNQRHCPH